MAHDTSFVHQFNWSDPDRDIQRAVEIITCAFDHEEGSCPVTAEEYLEVHRLLASNPDTPAAVLDHMSACLTHPHLLERVAANSSAPIETLRRLAHNPSDAVRSAVAESNNLDLDTLLLLAGDPSMDVRFTIAENFDVPIDILQLLEADENPYVAHRAAMTRRRLVERNELPVPLPQYRNQGIRRIV